MPDVTQPNLALRLEHKQEIAGGIYLLEFRHPQASELPEFGAGAHVAITVPNGLVRKYSLCNDPAERSRYEIGRAHV